MIMACELPEMSDMGLDHRRAETDNAECCQEFHIGAFSILVQEKSGRPSLPSHDDAVVQPPDWVDCVRGQPLWPAGRASSGMGIFLGRISRNGGSEAHAAKNDTHLFVHSFCALAFVSGQLHLGCTALTHRMEQHEWDYW